MNIRLYLLHLLFLSIVLASSGCYKLRGHYGGTKNFESIARKADVENIALPGGYKIEAFSKNLTYPTGITFDDEANLYVVEAGYSYGEVWTTPKILKIDGQGNTKEIARGDKNGPWNGLAFSDGFFYVAEGGALEGGKILKISKDGTIITLVEHLPSMGDHQTNGPVVKDGYVYFGQGVATNSGVVGLDNFQFGWLKRHPDVHDIPCQDITLNGQNFTSDNPLTENKKDKVSTGAFSAFGTETKKGQIIKGQIPCNGAIMRVPVNGGKIELVASGLRNPFGLKFSPEGELYVTENNYDTRGSRPGFGNGDVLWKITSGSWYGWPDFSEGRPMTDKDYKTPHDDPKFLLATHPMNPPKPSAIMGVHSSATGLDFSKSEAFGYLGEAFIAQFGDMAPNVGRIYEPVGFKVVRVNVKTGVIEDFITNKGYTNAPASQQKGSGIERPIDVKFDPTGNILYVVDFGIMPMTEQGPSPKKNTGMIWKVSKEGSDERSKNLNK